MMKTVASLMIALWLVGLADAQPMWTTAWRNDPVWYDGQAELANYDASRVIYGQPRAYVARFMTNKEHVSLKTFTKSDAGVEVFKFHVREDIPTPRYTYHYSTMVYVDTQDVTSLKLDMGSQEDCGASMKRIIHHDGKLTWSQYAYFPGMGHRQGSFAPAGDWVFMDALPLVLRGYPFDQPREMKLSIVPEQTTTRWSPTRPESYRLIYVGQEHLDLPVGPRQAHHLQLRFAGPTREARKPIDFWFDANPDTGHIMLKYVGPEQTYALRSVARDTYW